jgi:hypothetical protein
LDGSEEDDAMSESWRMSPKERWKFACVLRHAANVISLPAHPAMWPDWMTPEKRQQIAAHFTEGARLIEPTRG